MQFKQQIADPCKGGGFFLESSSTLNYLGKLHIETFWSQMTGVHSLGSNWSVNSYTELFLIYITQVFIFLFLFFSLSPSPPLPFQYRGQPSPIICLQTISFFKFSHLHYIDQCLLGSSCFNFHCIIFSPSNALLPLWSHPPPPAIPDLEREN